MGALLSGCAAFNDTASDLPVTQTTASPRAAYFVQAQKAGESWAAQVLPQLLQKMAQAGVR